MSTLLKNLSDTTLTPQKLFKKVHIGIAVAEWNRDITEAMLHGAVNYLVQMGVREKHIHIRQVPGSYELPLATKWLIDKTQVDAVLALGCVIQGETRHFDFICDACANGIMQVGLSTGKPAIFGVLTTETEQQAKERAGGKHGNKGIEAAETALKMLLMHHAL
ncbi:MAG: 6,7-dimethyl-8-ribityllumazine synthase [Bacteroidota bacterium]|jgi:6,7-dimethyl-8-ribityllumazine synthase